MSPSDCQLTNVLPLTMSAQKKCVLIYMEDGTVKAYLYPRLLTAKVRTEVEIVEV